MDVRDFCAANAGEFSQALREWLAIPSVSADPARHGDEFVDLSRLLRGAETAAYLWEELAAAGAVAR
jgi:hypothetical protein